MDLRRFDLNLLTTLHALLQTKNVSAAAKQLEISQPANSGALNRLRQAFGDPLLVRAGRGMRTTPFADSLVPQLGDVLVDLEALIVASAPVSAAEEHLEIHLSASDHVIALIGASLLSRLKAASPRSLLRLAPYDAWFYDQLDSGKLDFACVPPVFEPFLPRARLLTDRWIGLVATENSRIGDKLTRAEFEATPQVAFVPPNVRRPGQDDFQRHAGIRREVIAYTNGFYQAACLIRGTPWMAMAPYGQAATVSAIGLRIVEMDFSMPAIEVDLIWADKLNDDPRHTWKRELILQTAAECLPRGTNAKS